MKKQTSIIIVLSLLFATAVIAVVAQTQTQSRAAREVWEYREIELDEQAIATPILNREGAQGWELINVISSCTLTSLGSNFENPKSKCRYFAYFKRAK